MTVRATWLANGSKLADSRLGIAALFAPASSSGLAVKSGVLRPNPLAVVQESTASVNVRIPAFQAVVQSGASNIGGAFLVTEDAAEPVAVLAGAGQPANSPRYDLIVLATTPDTDATHANPASLTVLRGAPSATPVDPTIPAGALALARVRVKAAGDYSGAPAVTNADIDQLAIYTGLAAAGDGSSAIGLRGPNTDQGVSNNTWQTLSLSGAMDHQVGSGLSYASSIVTVVQAGVYAVSALVEFDTTNAGRRLLRVEKFTAEAAGSGTTLAAAEVAGYSSGTGGMYPTLNAVTEVALAVGDKVRLIAYQTSGGSLAVKNTLTPCQLNLRRVG